MSILLESLSQNSSPKKGDVPDIHAQHFDDDLLGDEWLVQRVKIWRATAIILLAVLIGSWITFFLITNKNTEVQNKTLVNSATQTSINQTSEQNSVSNSESSETAPVNESVSKPIADSTGISKSDADEIDASAVSKTVYKPQKREPTPSTKNKTETAKVISAGERPAEVQMVESSPESSVVLLKEELSEELQQKFPSIEINSYVLAESKEDSFVILDGRFYKINQVISPNLILRDINKQDIVVEFYGQLVRLPNQ